MLGDSRNPEAPAAFLFLRFRTTVEDSERDTIHTIHWLARLSPIFVRCGVLIVRGGIWLSRYRVLNMCLSVFWMLF